MTTRRLTACLRPLTTALLTSGCLGLLPLHAGAASGSATFFWEGWVDTSWVESGNWDPAGPPTAGSEVIIAIPDAWVDFDSAPGLSYQSLHLGGGGGGAVLNQSANSLSFADWVSIGVNAGEIGIVNQTGGNFTVLGNTTVGVWGDGRLIIDGGAFEQSTPNTLFMVGDNPASTGRVDLISGSFRMLGNEEKLGGWGSGYFFQWGGDHQFGGGLYVGDYGYGEYHMLGGNLGPVLDTNGNPVAYAGIVMGEWAANGKFFHGGGKVDVDLVSLARQAGSTGYYEMTGSSAELKTNWLSVGQNGSGSFLQRAGLVGVRDDLNIGDAVGVSGRYTMQGGDLNTQVLRVGVSGIGLFEQTGGIVNVASTGGFSILVMAENPGSSGTYKLSGGTLNSETVYVGDSAAAVFEHSGSGEHNVQYLALGIYKDSTQHGQGAYQFSGGVLNSGQLVVGASGTGNFIQSGGDHHNILGIVLGEQFGSQGRYELSGGSLYIDPSNGVLLVNPSYYAAGSGQFVYSGGSFEGKLVNHGYTEFSGAGTRVVQGEVINADGALMQAKNTTVQFTGLFTNAGAFVSDPSVNSFAELVVTDTGYLVGGAGDQFLISGRFESSSTQNTLWFTQNSQLIFVGDTNHEFWITGADLGASTAGYSNNFGWGDLQLYDEVLFLQDGNSTPGGALYVGTIQGLNIVGDTVQNLHGNGLNVYYAPLANPGLAGKTYTLMSGGSLAPVPEPETWAMLLAGLGLVGFLTRKTQRSRFIPIARADQSDWRTS
jgi:hypothetical protein